MTGDPVADRLLRELWSRDEDYYARAAEHVRSAAAAGREYAFLDAALPAEGRILEVGCGEGSNLVVTARPGRRAFGCDLSPLAARLARERGFPVAVGAVEALPFPDGAFDAVFAVSVVEHLPEPERAFDAMIRALAPGGRLVVLSPQYGGPLCASPNRRGGGAGRFLRRLLRAYVAPDPARLAWERVAPRVLEGEAYEGDLDAVCEPELRSLVAFLEGRGLRVETASSGYEWLSWSETGGSAAQRGIRAALERLGRAGLRPYASFGPLVAVAARK